MVDSSNERTQKFKDLLFSEIPCLGPNFGLE